MDFQQVGNSLTEWRWGRLRDPTDLVKKDKCRIAANSVHDQGLHRPTVTRQSKTVAVEEDGTYRRDPIVCPLEIQVVRTGDPGFVDDRLAEDVLQRVGQHLHIGAHQVRLPVTHPDARPGSGRD